MDMEEEKTDKELFIQEEIREFAEAVRFGKKEDMDDSLDKMEEKIKGALVEKSRACIYLQQIIRAAGNVCGKHYFGYGKHYAPEGENCFKRLPSRRIFTRQ